MHTVSLSYFESLCKFASSFRNMKEKIRKRMSAKRLEPKM
jgi:DNA topoisomerase IB